MKIGKWTISENEILDADGMDHAFTVGDLIAHIRNEPRAVVASSMARSDAAGVIAKYKLLRESDWLVSAGETPFRRLYDACVLLCASYDDLLAARNGGGTVVDEALK